jgi:hypothetical protein
VAQSVQYVTTDWTTGVRSPTETEDFSSSLCVQTGSGVHPASCPMGTGDPFPGGKARPGSDADHSPPSSTEVKNEWELFLLSSHALSWRVARQLYFYLFRCRCENRKLFSVGTNVLFDICNIGLKKAYVRRPEEYGEVCNKIGY